MFTGLIESVGTMTSWQRRGRVIRLTVKAPFAAELPVGGSIAVDGACQTVVQAEGDVFSVEATGETLMRTTLSSWRGPRQVNLERPLRADGRLDGHMVTGHVDAIVRVLSRRVDPSGYWMDVAHDARLAHYVASQGSVALDGVSLTVAASSAEAFTVSLVPHTLERTTLGRKGPGDYLNLEVDLVARYIARMVGREYTPVRREEGWDEWV